MHPHIKTTLLFLLILSGSVIVKAKVVRYRHQAKENKGESKAFECIEALPEVKVYLNKFKKKKADILLYEKPDAEFKYYWLKVGMSGNDMYRTTFNFYVAQKTFSIYYLDTMDGEGNGIITLQQWRYWRNKPEFYKLHTWKNGKLVVLEDDKKKSSAIKKANH